MCRPNKLNSNASVSTSSKVERPVSSPPSCFVSCKKLLTKKRINKLLESLVSWNFQNNNNCDDTNDEYYINALISGVRRIFIVLAIFCLLPWWGFGRGYTQWFHFCSLLCVLTKSESLSRFCALQGLAVCVGWYASMGYDWYLHGPFGRILYWNCPQMMTQYIFNHNNVSLANNSNNMTTTDFSVTITADNNKSFVSDTHESLFMIFIAHVLDILGHPVLAYYFWRRNWYTVKEQIQQQQQQERHQKPTNRQQQESKKEKEDDTFVTNSKVKATMFFLNYTMSWYTIAFTWIMNRTWSLLHNWHFNGTLTLWYFGRDVYTILDLNACVYCLFMPSYIAETIAYLFVIGLKLKQQQKELQEQHQQQQIKID